MHFYEPRECIVPSNIWDMYPTTSSALLPLGAAAAIHKREAIHRGGPIAPAVSHGPRRGVGGGLDLISKSKVHGGVPRDEGGVQSDVAISTSTLGWYLVGCVRPLHDRPTDFCGPRVRPLHDITRQTDRRANRVQNTAVLRRDRVLFSTVETWCKTLASRRLDKSAKRCGQPCRCRRHSTR